VTPTAVAGRREEVSALGRSFKRAMVAVRRLRGRETHRPGAPSFAQYQLLFALAEGDGLSSGELAAASDLSPASVTGMIDALVDLGLVARTRSSADRRVVTCTLSGEGRRLVEERRAAFEQRWDEALVEFSSADLELAAAVFERIAAMFDALDEELRET
jgi:DNA-binding MarR family transcriptional regulator